MATQNFPAPYTPSRQPTLTDNLNIYLYTELVDISKTLAGILLMLPQPATAAPAAPKEGMIRMSQAPWRPLPNQTANQWVIYDATAGWTAL